MRLKSIHLQNYRLHKDFTAGFSEGISLLQGPNESGKSTLVEAIHRTLFLKAKVSGEIQKSMLSQQGGHPTVSLEFEAHGHEYLLTKQFSGVNGTASLERKGAATLSGDAAEEELSKLLRVNGMISGKQTKTTLPNRWAHLWVWQGNSGYSPLEAASESHQTLREKLQEKVGTNLSASRTDNQLIAKLQKIQDETFTAGGKSKAGSPLKLAEESLEEARKLQTEKKVALRLLESAAQELNDAEDSITRHSRTLAAAKKDLTVVTGKLKEATGLRESHKEKKRLHKEAENKFREVEEADARIRKIESTLTKKLVLAEPREKEIKTALSECDRLRNRLGQARKTTEETTRIATRALGRKSKMEAHASLLKTQAILTEIEKRQKKIAEIRKEHTETAKTLTRLEGFSDRVLTSLRKKEKLTSTAQARLEAYALRLDILSASKPVQVGKSEVKKGTSATLTEPTEVKTGDGTLLRLTPGGSTDLDTARSEAEQTRQAYSSILADLGVSSTEQAEQKANELRQAKSDCEKLQSRLDDLEPEETEQAANKAREELTRLETTRNKPIDGLGKVTYTHDLKEAETSLEEATMSHEEARRKAEDALRSEKILREELDQKAEIIDKLREAHREWEQELQRLKNYIQFEEKQWGTGEERSKKINHARARLEQTRIAEEEEEKKLTALGISDLEMDDKRLRQSLSNSENLLATARENRTRAQTRLERSDNVDPESEYKKAIGESERLEQIYHRVRHQAEARALLLKQLKEEQSRITAALSRPLEETAAPYLDSLFGPGGRAHLKWSEDGSTLDGLSIDRTHLGEGYFKFEELSHGTREQVALAMRLAMAQILATDHDGCLPLLLDDAFTHADKDRIQKLQRLLYRAAENGLQILLLTCHPENYSGLTAHEISLHR